MATRPNLPGGAQPRNTGAPRSGTTRRMMTPPPTQKQPRPKSTGASPAVKSSGAMPAMREGTQAGSQTPAPASGRQQPQQQGRQMARPKTSGLPIKTKIVVAMSGLAAGVSLLIFLVVMLMANKSLDDTIQQAGLGMLQQAEAIQRPYRSGLNEKALIAYFSQPVNHESRFGREWSRIQDQFWHPRIPACIEFANWGQLRDDMVWARVAGSMLDNPEDFRMTEAERVTLLGDGWHELKDLGPAEAARRPATPRRVNAEAMERFKTQFRQLFSSNGMEAARDSFAALRQRLHEEADSRVIDGASGLRRMIFREFKSDFVRDLDELTGTATSQVRYVVFTIPRDTLINFSDSDLNVISPNPTEGRIGVTTSGDVTRVGDVVVDRGARIGEMAAYGFRKEVGNGQTISIYLDREQIQGRKMALTLSILGISVVAIILALVLAFLIGANVTKPLETLMTDIQVISGGNFDHKPRARSKDEIGIVSKLLGDMAAGLKSAQEVWLENQGRKHDLDIAKEIQENLLPKHVPRIAGYDVSAYYSAAKEVGGDYYDFFLVDKTHLGMICADVSGKGIPGSMVMMMAKALISYEAQDNLSPRDIFCKVNRTLAKDIKRGMFVTAFYMLLDIPTARLTVASAGHNPLLLYRAATKQCIEVNPGGIALGFDKDGRLFERNMKEEVIQLQRGDRAVIYTDGITEAMSPTNEEFGEERMQAITIQCANKTSTEYLTTLVNAIQGHAQSDEQHDDITIVTLKVG